MNNKIKNIIVTSVFVCFVAFFAVLCTITHFNPKDYSSVEKRPLAQFPTDVTWADVLNNKSEVDPETGNVKKSPIAQFGAYVIDQFPFREFFRSLKAHFAMDVLNMKENNGYAVEEDSIVVVKPSYTEDELKALNNHLNRVNTTFEQYKNKFNFKGNVYVSIVPDKNYYFGAQYGYPAPDYEALLESVKGTLSEMEYIDLFGSLSLEDYYKTDWHWDQSKLDKVVAALGEAMGFEVSGDYKVNELSGFKGGYYDQSALYPELETLTYLTNDIIDSCTVYEFATGKTTGFYHHDIFENTENYTGKVDYDFYMNGRCGIQRIDNPTVKNGKTLVVFRDSYGANILPLIAEGYETVYSIDLRDTVTLMALNQLQMELGNEGINVDFENADVLFLYSTTVLVSSEGFK
jgi:hypothetical protein